MSETFNFYVAYSLLAVYDPDLDGLLNDWKGVHVAQGFAWRPGSVSFGTLVDSYPLEVEVRQAMAIDLRTETVRAILVPFDVPLSGRVGLSNAVNEEYAAVPPGSYALVFETGYLSNTVEDGTWVRLSFISQDSVEPAILRADEELSPPAVLDMHALPAI